MKRIMNIFQVNIIYLSAPHERLGGQGDNGILLRDLCTLSHRIYAHTSGPWFYDILKVIRTQNQKWMYGKGKGYRCFVISRMLHQIFCLGGENSPTYSYTPPFSARWASHFSLGRILKMLLSSASLRALFRTSQWENEAVNLRESLKVQPMARLMATPKSLL